MSEMLMEDYIREQINKGQYGVIVIPISTAEDIAYYIETSRDKTEPVRHGRWTLTYLKHIELANDEGHVYIHYAKCSECGNEGIMQFVDYNESFKEWYTDYCPHCGARMK